MGDFSIRKRAPYLYDAWFNDIDYDAAYDYYEDRESPYPAGGCSAVRKGYWYGRNLDWLYDNEAEFIVHVKGTEGRFASVGMAGGFADITEGHVSDDDVADLLPIIPFQMYDGINEKGLIANINVVPTDYGMNKAVAQEDEECEICAPMLIRYWLDNFETAKEAAEFTRDHLTVYFPEALHEMNYEVHFMLADPHATYILEFVDNKTVIIEASRAPYFTNFHLYDVKMLNDRTVVTPENTTLAWNAEDINGITEYGSGLERYNIIAKNWYGIQSERDMKTVMELLRYTRAYTNTEHLWYTEFVGEDYNLSCGSPAEDFEDVMAAAKTAYEERSRDTALTWQTVHSIVYNMASKSASVLVQEGVQAYTFSIYDKWEGPSMGYCVVYRDTVGVSGHYPGYCEILIESASDLPEGKVEVVDKYGDPLDDMEPAIGSVAYTADLSSLYMKGIDKEWHKIGGDA